MTKAREGTGTAQGKIVRRLRREQDAYLAHLRAGGRGQAPAFDVLILSGGGDYGAFGAGVLRGWGSVTDPAMARLEFDLVTGVSTGALIAPLALTGSPRCYDKLLDMYTNPRDDWFELRSLLFFLPGNVSFMSTDGLRRDLERTIDQDMLRRIALASEQDRVLAVNVTNLDVGAPHTFELTLEAQRAIALLDEGDPSGVRRVHSIMMASAAIRRCFRPR